MARKRVTFDEQSFVFGLKCCFKGLRAGESVHCLVLKHGFWWDLVVRNGLVHFYGEVGRVQSARKVFDEMCEGVRDVVTWSSLINVYVKSGMVDEGLRLFEMMKGSGVGVNEVTMIAVFGACAKKGDLELGRSVHDYNGELVMANKMFDEMPERNIVSWNAMIAGYSQNNKPKEAIELFNEMENAEMPMEPDKAVWGAVLNACRMHGNLELGKLATEKLIILDPNDSGIYVLMESLCATRNKWDEVKMVRSMMRGNGVKKTPGRSSIEVEGEFHEFWASDKSHPMSETMYNVLGEIILLSRLEDASDANFYV
nr:hypothetical protein [Tanacetum cinerariifolium]